MPSTGSNELQAAFIRGIASLWRDIHDRARKAIDGLDQASLDKTLGPQTNSIAVLITHLVGSENEAIAAVLGRSVDRVRAQEFEAKGRDAKALTALLDAADSRVSALAGEVDRIDLLAQHSRKNDATPRIDVEQLLGSYAHSREHVGHIELTAQLLRARA